jgi:tetratricopeptide (TPR) repeat protein
MSWYSAAGAEPDPLERGILEASEEGPTADIPSNTPSHENDPVREQERRKTSQRPLSEQGNGGASYNMGSLNATGGGVAVGHLEGDINMTVVRPGPSPITIPSLLPADKVVLIGRQADVEAISGLLRPHDGPPAMVLITGMPGVGKSALALRVAHNIEHMYPDGQLFVRLRGTDARALKPYSVLADMLLALGVGETAIPETLEKRTNLFRTRLWRKKVLLLLDDAGSEKQVLPLLPGSSTCAVLLTSRRKFPNLAARTVVVPELKPSAALELFGSIVGNERVSKDPSNAAEITRLCGNLPLAVRIAGARLALRPGLKLAAFASRLADERNRLNELETPDSEVRATLKLSIEDLASPDREAFVWLGVLEAADFTAWRLSALLNLDRRSTEKRIESLLSAQIVMTEQLEDDQEERFRMHDLLRLYARELVQQEKSIDERAEALQRTSRCFLLLAVTAASALEPGEDFNQLRGTQALEVDDPDLVDGIRDQPLRWFETERQALVIAIERMASQEAHDLVIGLTRCMTTFFDYHARWDDWSTAMNLALAAAQATQNKGAEAALLRSHARLQRYRGNLTSSDHFIRESLRVGRKAGNDHEVAESLIDCTRLGWYLGRRSDAHEAYDEALRHFTKAANEYGKARCWASIALVLRDEGHINDAVARCNEALKVFRDIGDKRWIAATLTTLADLLVDQQRPDEARFRVDEALPLLRELGFRWWEAVTLRTLGLAHAAEGRLGDADSCLRSSVQALHELSLDWWEAVARVSLAEIVLQEGNHSAALKELQPADTVFRTRNDSRLTAIATTLRSQIAWEEGSQVDLMEVCQAVTVHAAYGDKKWAAVAARVIEECGGCPSSRETG